MFRGLPTAASDILLLSPLLLALCAAVFAATRTQRRVAAGMRRSKEIENVLEASRDWWRQPNPVDILQPVAHAARVLTGATLVTAYSRDDVDPSMLQQWALDPVQAAATRPARLFVPEPDVLASWTHRAGELLLPLELDTRELVGLLWLDGVPPRLGNGVRDALKVLADQAAIALHHAQRHARALAQASEDGLTGLLNHRVFHVRLDEEVARARRSGRPLSLLMVDLDGFGEVNNRHGHQKGDATLVAVAEALRECLRTSDVGGRYGGDEFAIILPETSLQEAMIVAERMRVAIIEHTAVVTSQTIHLGASIGVAAFPLHAQTREDLVLMADRAAYAVKHSGKGRVGQPEDALLVDEQVAEGLTAQLDYSNLVAVEALAMAVDAKDNLTHGHSQRVSTYSVVLAQAMGLSDTDVARIKVAGLLHDVGKIGVPDAILTKLGPLTDDEFAVLEQHTIVGERMVAAIPYLREIAPAVRHHHERWDGHGYPNSLVGKVIPQDAAIIMVADSFDAMISSRTYRPALTLSEARRQIKMGSGTQFAPHVVAAFERAIADGTLKPLSSGGTIQLSVDQVARASSAPRVRRRVRSST